MRGTKMIDSDQERFGKILAALGEAHGKHITAPRIAIYFKVLKPYSIDDLESVGGKLLETNEFFPAPAAFVKMLAVSGDDAAVLAWLSFCEALERHGDNALLFDDAAIGHAVNKLGGHVKLGKLPEKEFQFRKQDFLRIYKFMSRQKLEPVVLIGRYSSKNPRRIGDSGENQAKALAEGKPV